MRRNLSGRMTRQLQPMGAIPKNAVGKTDKARLRAAQLRGPSV